MSNASYSEDELTQLSLMREEEIDALVEQGLLSGEQRWEPELHDGFHFAHPELNLVIKTGDSYPAEPLDYCVENLTLPRLAVDDLRITLRQIAIADNENNRLKASNARDEPDTCGHFDFVMTSVHLASKTGEYLEAFRTKIQENVEQARNKGAFDEELGLNLKSIVADHSIKSILDKTPEEICEGLPGEFRVLHIESIVRDDLIKSLFAVQAQIREELERVPLRDLRARRLPSELRAAQRLGGVNRKEDVIEQLVKPQITYHGTRRDYVPSIVRQGFLLPGARDKLSGERHEVRCGSTYGRGIYSSPSSAFALSYTGSAEDGGIRATKPNEYDGIKLIVCATVMGTVAQLTRSDGWQQNGQPAAKATSHIGNSGMEYVVFDQRQILPCYVIHMDWGQDNAKFFRDIPADPATWVDAMNMKAKYAWQKLHKKDWERTAGPGEIQRQEEERLQRARKFLGYGFGPKSGSALVVEEIGAVDEDDEDYGEYQKDRIGTAQSGTDYWDLTVDCEEVIYSTDGRFNEYAEARVAPRWRN